MPGYGFSSPFPPASPYDHGMESAAFVLNHLMTTTLGFQSYTVQGGDVGARVGRILAAKHEKCVAALLNYSPMPQPKGMSMDDLTEMEKQGLKRGEWFWREGCAYGLEQASRPATIGLVLGSNPLGLLAWVGEKFLDWSDEGSFPHDTETAEGLKYSRKLMDEILKSVSLYWLTGAMHTCFWSYRDTWTMPGGGEPRAATHKEDYWIKEPKVLGYQRFPREIVVPPRRWVETSGNLVYWKEHEVGGHFAALEQPGAMLEDVEEFVRGFVA